MVIEKKGNEVSFNGYQLAQANKKIAALESLAAKLTSENLSLKTMEAKA